VGEFAVLCTASPDGADCVAEATMISLVPLCDEHQLQVALQVVPDLMVAALRHVRSGAKPVSLPPAERAAIIAGASPKPISAHMSGPHGPVVYFADGGSRIKIGFSTNLRSRIRSLSMQEKDVLLLLQGGLTLERALHATYDKERIDSTEWFAKSERLVAFIESKRAQLDGQHRQKTQRQMRKHMARSASASLPTPGKRADRLDIIRDLIRNGGGDPANLPLKTIQERFGVSQATASRMRSDVSSHLKDAP